MKFDIEKPILTPLTLQDIENELDREINESEDALLILIAKVIIDIIKEEEL